MFLLVCLLSLIHVWYFNPNLHKDKATYVGEVIDSWGAKNKTVNFITEIPMYQFAKIQYDIVKPDRVNSDKRDEEWGFIRD